MPANQFREAGTKTPQPPETETACRQLEALADEMSRRGFFTKVTTGRQPPFVTVTSKNLAQMTENVYAAATSDGIWWFWWSWAERITSLDDVATAAGAIAYVLSTAPGGPPTA